MSKLRNLILDNELSSEYPLDVFIEVPKKFSKSLCVKIFVGIARPEEPKELYKDSGLWSWISAFMLEVFMPIKKAATKEFSRRRLFISSDENNGMKYYRQASGFFVTYLY